MANCKSLLLLIAVLCFLPGSIFAYKCAPGTPKSAFARADAVFSGEVIAQESREAELAIDDEQKKSKVIVTVTEFKVEKFWKGSSEKTLFLVGYEYADKTIPRPTTERNVLSFKVNQNYFVYAYQYQNVLRATNRCSRTGLLENATVDLRELGKGDAPTKPVDKTLREVLTEFIDKWNN